MGSRNSSEPKSSPETERDLELEAKTKQLLKENILEILFQLTKEHQSTKKKDEKLGENNPLEDQSLQEGEPREDYGEEHSEPQENPHEGEGGETGLKERKSFVFESFQQTSRNFEEQNEILMKERLRENAETHQNHPQQESGQNQNLAEKTQKEEEREENGSIISYSGVSFYTFEQEQPAISQIRHLQTESIHIGLNSSQFKEMLEDLIHNILEVINSKGINPEQKNMMVLHELVTKLEEGKRDDVELFNQITNKNIQELKNRVKLSKVARAVAVGEKESNSLPKNLIGKGDGLDGLQDTSTAENSQINLNLVSPGLQATQKIVKTAKMTEKIIGRNFSKSRFESIKSTKNSSIGTKKSRKVRKKNKMLQFLKIEQEDTDQLLAQGGDSEATIIAVKSRNSYLIIKDGVGVSLKDQGMLLYSKNPKILKKNWCVDSAYSACFDCYFIYESSNQCVFRKEVDGCDPKKWISVELGCVIGKVMRFVEESKVMVGLGVERKCLKIFKIEKKFLENFEEKIKKLAKRALLIAGMTLL